MRSRAGGSSPPRRRRPARRNRPAPWRAASLTSLEHRRALLEERGHAFGPVLARERGRERLLLERARDAAVGVLALLHHALGGGHREGTLLGDLLAGRDRCGHELLGCEPAVG